MPSIIPIVTGIDAKVLAEIISAIFDETISSQLKEIMVTVQEIKDSYAVLKEKLEAERVEFATFATTVIDKITKLQEKLDQNTLDATALADLKAEIMADTESVSSIVVTPEGFSPVEPEPTPDPELEPV